MGFQRYVDWVLDVPMYFVYRDGKYIDAAGRSFRKFMAGEYKDLGAGEATTGDWADHVTTAFPEVRLKKYIEMRGADGGPWNRLCALPALFVGLLYDQTALDAAWDLVKDWTVDEMQAMRRDVPRLALKAPFRKGTVLDVAREMVAIARKGLAARARFNRMGDGDETHFLNPLQQIVDSGITPAERKLALFHGKWGGSVKPIYDEFAY
jgi:glutamate--cysteine ligase